VPELPEVETVKRGLSMLIVERVVKSVEFDTPKSFPNPPGDVKQFLINAEIRSVRRRAKVLLIDLSTHYSLMIHLKMTGQLVFRGDQSFGAGHPSDSLIGELPDKSTRVTITFTGGSCLFFNDQRKFGWMKLLPTVAIKDEAFMVRVGPEPLSDDFTPQQFAGRFARRLKSPIKAALLDQAVVAGVGNIYADESLWGAQIHPATPTGLVTQKQLEKLYEEVRLVMNLAIEKGGSTDRNYVNAEGKRGSYLTFARVFHRDGLLCPRCGATIIKLRVAARGTHICPVCQKVKIA
jgi:formamidopyrimidine-DNA glycosylase